ncbi:MAG: hypothetical protein FWH27_08345 [Planctomycetaceae bacterium]|nr:hypothetical protein [Planctomycetaceae bacterium]
MAVSFRAVKEDRAGQADNQLNLGREGKVVFRVDNFPKGNARAEGQPLLRKMRKVSRNQSW